MGKMATLELTKIDELYEQLYLKDIELQSLSDMLTDANEEIERLWQLCRDNNISVDKPEIPF